MTPQQQWSIRPGHVALLSAADDNLLVVNRLWKGAIMRLVNRAAITIRPKQPYIDWANALDHDGPRMTLDHLPEQSVYLVEDIADFLVDTGSVIQRYFREIFKHELDAWHRVENDWPKNRDYGTFMEWFEVEVHSMVFDIHRGRLESELFEL